MVIAHPVSSSDNNMSSETLQNQDAIVINSNSLESVPSIMSEVRNFSNILFISDLESTGIYREISSFIHLYCFLFDLNRFKNMFYLFQIH